MKNVITIVIGILTIVAMAISLYAINSTPKIGYVQSQELIFGYDGTKEVQRKFKGKKQAWEGNIDSLEMDFQKAVTRYKESSSKLSTVEKENVEISLRNQQESSMKYIESIEQKILTEEEELLTGVLNQINGMIKDYGIEHNYNVIFGTTTSGNVLYGEESHDITEDVLKELNDKFRGI